MSKRCNVVEWMVACACGLAVTMLLGCAPSPPPKAKAKEKAKATKAETPKKDTAEPAKKEELIPEPAKKEEAKPEAPKKEEEAKPETPMKEEAKPEPKADEAKPEAPKKDKEEEAKPEPAKKEEAKPETPMKEEAKPEPKADEAKPETPKKDKEEEAKPEPAKKEEPKPEPKAEAAADEKPLAKAELLAELPESCNTPDGMTLLPDQSVIVSVPNYNDQKQPPLLIKITKDNKVEEFFKLPPNPDTGRFGPMGLRVAPSGDLYLADNQLFHDKDPKKFLYGKSRLVRIVVKDGKPAEVVPVATGLNVANGIAIHEGYVYITETILVPESKPLVSGVFRFKLDEKGVKMKEPLEDDPHLVLTMKSEGKVPFGADGICFDKEGRLYVSNFGDGLIYRVLLDKDGKASEQKVFAKADFMKSCDGMDYDAKTDKIYSADLVGNAVSVIDMEGKVQRLAADPDNDGSQGQLRSPSEALVRGDTIVVANMDFVIEGGVIKKYSTPATVSVIKLDGAK